MPADGSTFKAKPTLWHPEIAFREAMAEINASPRSDGGKWRPKDDGTYEAPSHAFYVDRRED